MNIKLLTSAALILALSQTLPAENLYRVEVNGQWGFINRQGKMKIKPQYDDCYYQFSEGLAGVKNLGKWGFINKRNEMVIPAKFDGAYFIRDGRIPVNFGPPFEGQMKTAYIDLEGNYIVKPTLDLNYTWFRGGFIHIKQNDKWGYMNKDGKHTIPCIYDETAPFSNGLAGVRIQKGTSGFIDTNGKWKIKLENAIPHSYAGFANGLAPVFDIESKKWGFINRGGEWGIKPQYEGALAFHEGLAVVTTIVKDEDGWPQYLKGAINPKGQWVIKPKYEVLWDFEDGMAKAQLNGGKIGFVSTTGKDLITPHCGLVDPFYKGLAYITVGDSYDESMGYSGYINKQGEWVWRPENYKQRIAAFLAKKQKEANRVPTINISVNKSTKAPHLALHSSLKIPINGPDAGKLKFTLVNHTGGSIFLQQKTFGNLDYSLHYKDGGSSHGGGGGVMAWPQRHTYQMLAPTHLDKAGERFICGCCLNYFEATVEKKLLQGEARGTVSLPIRGYSLKSGKAFSEYIELNIKLVKSKHKPKK